MTVMEDPEGPITNRNQISSKSVVEKPADQGRGVGDSLVELALKAGQEYWDSPDQVASCNECDGTGKVQSGDSQDWCGTCDGGVINTGTEEGAMRAALEAAIAALTQPKGDATYPDTTGWAGPGHGKIGQDSPCCRGEKLYAKASIHSFQPLHCTGCGKGSWGLHYPGEVKS